MQQHACVQEAAVMGEPDTEWGQAVVAYVVLLAVPLYMVGRRKGSSEG